MHHGTCVTHVPWCMSGSLTRGGGGENVPGIPGACANLNLTYLARGPLGYTCPASISLVCNEAPGTLHSVPITGAVYVEFQQSLVSKPTSKPSTRFADSLLIWFIEAEFFLIGFNRLILKVWGSASRVQHALTTGIVRRQFPSLRVTTWRN